MNPARGENEGFLHGVYCAAIPEPGILTPGTVVPRRGENEGFHILPEIVVNLAVINPDTMTERD